MDALTAKLQRVAKLRELADAHTIAIQELKEQISKTPEGIALVLAEGVLKTIKNELAQAEAGARTDALYLYESTGTRDFGGASVKMFTVVEYKEDDARTWCQTNAPDLLVLDKKRFEKGVADGILSPNIARVIKEARAQLAGNLDKYLGESYRQRENHELDKEP